MLGSLLLVEDFQNSFPEMAAGGRVERRGLGDTDFRVFVAAG